MSQPSVDVLKGQLDIRLPTNWELVHGYTDNALFVAIWWSESGESVQVDDGRCRVTVRSNPASEDLIQLAVKAGGEELNAALGYAAEIASHCLLANLEKRTVYYAPFDDVLTWMAESIPLIDEESTKICAKCGGLGWVRAGERPETGYVPCRSCSIPESTGFSNSHSLQGEGVGS